MSLFSADWSVAMHAILASGKKNPCRFDLGGMGSALRRLRQMLPTSWKMKTRVSWYSTPTSLAGCWILETGRCTRYADRFRWCPTAAC